MIKEHDSLSEVYLKRIVEQNDTIIELLKVIAGNSTPTTPTEADENQMIIDKVGTLTKKERQIIDLIMAGMMNKQMAYDLAVSLSTIEVHRSRIMKKMGAKNVAQLTKEYMQYKALMKL